MCFGSRQAVWGVVLAGLCALAVPGCTNHWTKSPYLDSINVGCPGCGKFVCTCPDSEKP